MARAGTTVLRLKSHSSCNRYSNPKKHFLEQCETLVLLLLSRETGFLSTSSCGEADVLFHLGRHIMQLEQQVLYAQLGLCPDICFTVLPNLFLFSRLLTVSHGPRAPFLLGSHCLGTCCSCPGSGMSGKVFIAPLSKARTDLEKV